MNDKERTKAPDGRPEGEQPAWRREFPIETPQEQYVGRRDFVKFLVLTSLAFVAGQFWIVVQHWRRGGKAPPAEQAVATLANVGVGSSLAFNFPSADDPCLLLRPDEKTLVAYGQKCTHLSCAVVPDQAHDCLRCPCHQGTFDLATGRPLAGPPRRPLDRIALEVRDGVVYATKVELRTV